MDSVELTFCIVNTEQCDLLERCLHAVAAARAQLPFRCEVLVLDNASSDNSVQMARAHPTVDTLIALEQRRGKAANDSLLLERARGQYCLLLNEDSELLPGTVATLHRALDDCAQAAAAGAQILDPQHRPVACAWRFPSPATALAGAFFLHRFFTVHNRGSVVREVDWAQSAALLIRREYAAAIGYLDSQFFVYGDEVDFCKRLHDAGWSVLYVPDAQVIHHEQLKHGTVPQRRIVEFARNRDYYMRKHHSRLAAAAVRWLTAWTYALRAFAALWLPGHNPRRYWTHVSATLQPHKREGIREVAQAYNRELGKKKAPT
jgi:GT2 family glycosyltransferase